LVIVSVALIFLILLAERAPSDTSSDLRGNGLEGIRSDVA
jgi:hypothetical protein